jgi:glyoxylase-like metal-dependent hydrolase (beta-lactamase superfamily II)
MELIQHVYQIKVPLTGLKFETETPTPFKTRKENFISVIEQGIIESMPPSHVNAYIIEGNKGNLIIDTGWNTPEAYSVLSSEMKKFGFGIKDITHVVVTHIHPDHCGLAGKIKQLSNAYFAMSELEAGLMHSRYVDVDELIAKTQQLFVSNGVPHPEATNMSKASLPAKSLVVVVSPDTTLKSGDILSFEPYEFTVLETPGHSPGHIILYEPHRKWLFTGDTILPEITPNISFHPQSGQDPLGDYFHSLEEIYKLDVNFAFPGHGPAFSGVKQIIEGIMRHHQERKRDIIKIIENNTKSAYQITQEIPWMVDIKDKSFTFMNTLNKRFAVSETIAHLEYLVKNDEAGKSVENGISMYSA